MGGPGSCCCVRVGQPCCAGRALHVVKRPVRRVPRVRVRLGSDVGLAHQREGEGLVEPVEATRCRMDMEDRVVAHVSSGAGVGRGWRLRLAGIAIVAAVAGACSSGSSSEGSLPTAKAGSVGESTLEDDSGAPVASFVEDPEFPVNILAGESLGQTDDLVIVTSRQIIDVGRDEIESISGLPEYGDGTVAEVVEAAGAAVLSVGCPVCDDPVRSEVFVLRDGSAGPAIAEGRASPGIDGVWVTQRDDASCNVLQVAPDGSSLRPAREIDCDLSLGEETSLGVVAGRGSTGVLLDPETLDETESSGRVIAVFDHRVLVERAGSLTVVDPATDVSTPVKTPESDGSVGYGIVSPDERFVLVAFGNPAWPGPRQLLDLWLLDTSTLEWSQLPGMPVAVALKSFAFDWAGDGRVVMLGAFDGVGTAVVTWKPLEDRLRLRMVNAQASSSIVAMSTTTE